MMNLKKVRSYMKDESISLDEKLFVINIFIVLFVLGSTTLIIMFARSMWFIGLSTFSERNR